MSTKATITAMCAAFAIAQPAVARPDDEMTAFFDKQFAQ
jgi:hypothetical protein